ncbi:MAG: UPF0175 family protein [Gammaproteobacteria bacterium]|nr:UPF0175 family protein [Gammaproteobacteria bacterium]MDH5652892.1 UPF0175 family protein [Gammaproteobacteria bacterium]
MKIDIPDHIANAIGLTEQELLASLVESLYNQGRLSIVFDGESTEMCKEEFLKMLAEHNRRLHYDPDDFNDSIDQLRFSVDPADNYY